MAVQRPRWSQTAKFISLRAPTSTARFFRRPRSAAMRFPSRRPSQTPWSTTFRLIALNFSLVAPVRRCGQTMPEPSSRAVRSGSYPPRPLTSAPGQHSCYRRSLVSGWERGRIHPREPQHRAKVDGTESRQIVSVAADATPFYPRWSPDGSRLRFSVQTAHTPRTSLWEVAADGKDLHPLLSGWNNPPSECCGSWTPDGRYFLFQSQRGGVTNVWAIREGGSLFEKVSHEPVPLTTGATSTSNPVPSTDGKKIFVVTPHLRGELVRYDAASHQFAPYLSGISAMGVSPSATGTG